MERLTEEQIYILYQHNQTGVSVGKLSGGKYLETPLMLSALDELEAYRASGYTVEDLRCLRKKVQEMEQRNLVRDLRAVQAKYQDTKYGTGELCIGDMARDAADEIERLLWKLAFVEGGRKTTRFPILGSKPQQYIPWEFIALHEKQALINHGQTLERLAERGGLSYAEVFAVLKDRPFERMDEAKAKNEVNNYFAYRFFF